MSNEQNQNELTKGEQDQIDEDFFDEANLIPSNWMKFENPGDKIRGILVDVENKEAEGDFPAQKIYKLELPNKEIWNVGVSVQKRFLMDRLKNVKIGQEIGFFFKEEVPSKTKGYSPAKNILVYAGKVHPEYANPPTFEGLNKADENLNEGETNNSPDVPF